MLVFSVQMPSLKTQIFAWRYHSSARVSPARGRALPRAGLLELVTRYLLPGGGQWRRQDLLRSWGTPIVLLPCSPTPAGPTHQAITMRRCGPRSVHHEGSCIRTFEAQSHGFGTRRMIRVRRQSLAKAHRRQATRLVRVEEASKKLAPEIAAILD